MYIKIEQFMMQGLDVEQRDDATVYTREAHKNTRNRQETEFIIFSQLLSI